MIPPTVENIRAALQCLDPDMPGGEWVKIGMAIHAELGEEGFAVWDSWSARGASYDAQNIRDRWRGFKAGAGIEIGTLFGAAKAQGFKLAGDAVRTSAPAARAPKARNPDTAEEYRRRADVAARDAVRMWSESQAQGVSPYLQHKGIGAHGVRVARDGTLLVPLRNAAGELQSLQRIFQRRDGAGFEKRYLPGGRKSGLWHMLGDAAGAAAVLLAEGYATAATLHEATARPVAVAFDEGNLAKVARSLREIYPAALILACGDDDRETEARSGKNPGRLAAASAARAAGADGAPAGAVFPEGLPPGGTDFNDLAAHAGLDKVRELVESALQAPTIPKPQRGQSVRTSAPDEAAAADGAMPHGFAFLDDWLWYEPRGDDGGGNSGAIKVCTWLKVEARTVDSDGGSAGFLLAFRGVRGDIRRWVMPARMLAGDGTEYRAALLGYGLSIAPGKKARDLLTLYLQLCRPEAITQCVERVGWHGRSFVLPRETLQAEAVEGQEPERIVFQSGAPTESGLKQRGTLKDWQRSIGAACVGNSRLLFAVSCAFVGTLLRPAGAEGGGFHLRGGTSSGKTTALRVAASVWGGANYLQSWRATDNALESVAAQHSDGLLILDEIAEVEASVVGACSYMIANGQGKGRRSANSDTMKPRQTWLVQFLSAGEVGLAQHMKEGGKTIRGGQELRMAEIPADAGAGFGLFDELHGRENGAAMARALKVAAEANYGVAGRAWLEWAVGNVDSLRRLARTSADQLASEWIPPGASEQVHRVAARFALVAAAGEMATAAGITGWQPNMAAEGVRKCFEAWMSTRVGGSGNSDHVLMVRQVAAWLITNQDSRLTAWERDHKSERAPRTILAAGFRRDVPNPEPAGHPIGREFFIQRDVFRDEVCEGYDVKVVCRLGVEAGWLEPGPNGEFCRSERLPTLGKTRVYRITSAIFDCDE